MSEAVKDETAQQVAEGNFKMDPPTKGEVWGIAEKEFREDLSMKASLYSKLEESLKDVDDDDEEMLEKGNKTLSETLGEIFDSVKVLASNSRGAVRQSLAHTLVFLRAVSRNEVFIAANFKNSGANKDWKREALIQIYNLKDHPTRLSTYAKTIKYIEDNWKETDGSLEDASAVYAWIETNKGITAIYAKATKKTSGGGGSDKTSTPEYGEANKSFANRSLGQIAAPARSDKEDPFEEGARVLLLGDFASGQIDIKHVVEDSDDRVGTMMFELGEKIIKSMKVPDDNLFWRRVTALTGMAGKDGVVAVDDAGAQCTISNERSGHPSLVGEVFYPAAPIFKGNPGRQRLEEEEGKTLRTITSASLISLHTVTHVINGTEVTIDWIDEKKKKTSVKLEHLSSDDNEPLVQYVPRVLNDWTDLTFKSKHIRELHNGLVKRLNDLSKPAADKDPQELADDKIAFKSEAAKTARSKTKAILTSGSKDLVFETPYVNGAGLTIELDEPMQVDLCFHFKTADLKKIFSFMEGDGPDVVKVSFNENMMKFVTDGWAIHVPYADNGAYRTNGFVPND